MAYDGVQPPANTGQSGAKVIRCIDITEVSGPFNTNTVVQQIISLGDPVNAAVQAAVTTIHTTPNQVIPTGGSILTAGVAQIQNVSGKLDSSLEGGTDGVPARGVPVGINALKQVIATISTVNVAANASAVNINVATSSGFLAGGVAVIDTAASGLQESQVITAVPSGTQITVDHLNNSHPGAVTPYPVVMGVYNEARDAAGELDIALGVGAPTAVGYVYDGVTYTRERSVTALGSFTTFMTGAITANSNPVVVTLSVAPPASTQVGSPLLIMDGANTEIQKITAVNVAGKTVTISQLTNNHAINVNVRISIAQYNAAPVNAPAYGIPAEASIVYSGLSAIGDILVSMEKDINAVFSLSATLNPTLGTAASAGIDADVELQATFAALQTYADSTLSAAQGGRGGERLVSPGGRTATNVPAGAGTTVVKTGAGRLVKALVVAAGTGAGNTNIYDNTAAGGLLIGIIPATVNVTGTPFTFEMPATVGITASNPANGPQLTISAY